MKLDDSDRANILAELKESLGQVEVAEPNEGVIYSTWTKLDESTRLIVLEKLARSFPDFVVVGILEVIDVMRESRLPKIYQIFGSAMNEVDLFKTAKGYSRNVKTIDDAIKILSEQGIECVILSPAPAIELQLT